jgi:hypothetical protein
MSIENSVDSPKKTTDKAELPICFVMMPFSTPAGPDYEADHFKMIYEQIFEPAIISANYKPFRVDEDHISDLIIYKIFDGVQNAPMALCDLSSRNPNVLYELGLRQAYDLPVVLVQDEKTKDIFDVSGITTIKYCSNRFYENVIKAREDIRDAILENTEDKDHGYSIVKMVNVKKATMETSTISSAEITNYQLVSIQQEIRDIKKSLVQKSSNNDSFISDITITNGNSVRLTINKFKTLLNRLKSSDYVNDADLDMYNSTANYLQKELDAFKGKSAGSTYNHLKSLMGSIWVELERLEKDHQE